MLLNYHIGRFVLGLLCVGVLVRFGWGGIWAAGNWDTTPAEPHQNSNTQQTKNETANSRKLLKMGILMPETC